MCVCVCVCGGGAKVRVPTMARSDFPNGKFRFFPRWSLWSCGGGGGGHYCQKNRIQGWGRQRSPHQRRLPRLPKWLAGHCVPTAALTACQRCKQQAGLDPLAPSPPLPRVSCPRAVWSGLVCPAVLGRAPGSSLTIPWRRARGRAARWRRQGASGSLRGRGRWGSGMHWRGGGVPPPSRALCLHPATVSPWCAMPGEALHNQRNAKRGHCALHSTQHDPRGSAAPH